MLTWMNHKNKKFLHLTTCWFRFDILLLREMEHSAVSGLWRIQQFRGLWRNALSWAFNDLYWSFFELCPDPCLRSSIFFYMLCLILDWDQYFITIASKIHQFRSLWRTALSWAFSDPLWSFFQLCPNPCLHNSIFFYVVFDVTYFSVGSFSITGISLLLHQRFLQVGFMFGQHIEKIVGLVLCFSNSIGFSLLSDDVLNRLYCQLHKLHFSLSLSVSTLKFNVGWFSIHHIHHLTEHTASVEVARNNVAFQLENCVCSHDKPFFFSAF